MDVLTSYLGSQRDQRRRTQPTLRMYENILRNFWRDVVAPADLASVTLEQVEAWVQRDRLGGRAGKTPTRPSDATVQRDTVIIRTMFAWATQRGYLERNPVPREVFTAPAPKNVMPRPIDDETWRAWWQARLPVELRAALVLGFFGGLRRAELATLHTSQLVFRDSLRIVAFKRKGQGEHTLALGTMLDVYAAKLPQLLGDVSEVLDVLRAVSHSDGLVVSCLDAFEERRRPDEVYRLIQRTRQRHKLPPFTTHQLRHSAASNLVRCNVPLPLVANLLNHSDIATTMRYVKASGDELRSWLDSNERG